MAHFAQLNENNAVTQVIVVHNNELVVSKQVTENEDGTVSVSVIESEDKGIEFCKSLYGADTKWVQTSYNGNFRGKYAGIGDTYDAEANIFRTPLVDVSPSSPVVELVVASQQAVVVESQSIPALTTANIQTISSADIPALTTSDLQSLTTKGL